MSNLKSSPIGVHFRYILRQLPITALILALATLLSTVFFHFSSNVINISLIYILAILFTARATNCYSMGILASVYSVFWVNFAYTYPFMSLNFTLTGYPITFIGMTLISTLTSSMTIHQAKQNQLLQEKDRMLMEAEKETMRANLLRAISHDLRTPLTTILGTSSALIDHGENLSAGEVNGMVQNIYTDADWLLHMVENLLSITRIQEDQGISHVSKSEEPLEEVVSEAVQRFRRRFPDASFKVSVPDELIMIPMDATLIEQVINNLLENAYYHAGGTDRRIELTAVTQENFALFSVRDYGCGIDPQLLGTLFEGGSTSRGTGTDAHKGMGIGLSICRTIVNAHGGQIYAGNHENGAEFTFTLPDWREDYGA